MTNRLFSDYGMDFGNDQGDGGIEEYFGRDMSESNIVNPPDDSVCYGAKVGNLGSDQGDTGIIEPFFAVDALAGNDGMVDSHESGENPADQKGFLDKETQEALKGAAAEKQKPISIQRMIQALRDSDRGDAELLDVLYPGRFRFDHRANAWYVWHEDRWKVDIKKVVFRTFILRVAREYVESARVAHESGEMKLAAAFHGRARALNSIRRVEQVAKMASVLPQFSLDGTEWDKDSLLLGVLNGVVDLRTGDFRKSLPEDYILRVCPVEWAGLDVVAPKWEGFLSDVFSGNTNLIKFMQALLGYGISGKSTERILPILWGSGANGKTTMLEAVASVLGKEMAMSTQADVLMDFDKSGNNPQPAVYSLIGKRIVWANESAEGRRINAGLVKQLTGGDRISVRTLYQAHLTEFKPTHLILLLTNHKPHIPADDQAVWDRILLIPFENRFVENPSKVNEKQRDTNLRMELEGEAAGILAWLVRGCLDWQRNGLNPPSEVKVATQLYREEEDTLGMFLKEVCILGNDAKVTGSELYEAYSRWCQENNIGPMSGTKFGLIMTNTRGFEKKRVRNAQTYHGIGLLKNYCRSDGGRK